MKRNFLLFGLLIILFSACTKESFNATKQATIDDEKIQAYIAANHLSVTKDPSGIYYQIITSNPGSHPSVANADTVQVSYTGKLLNGGVFDFQKDVNLPLANLTTGFQHGMTLIGANGSTPYSRIFMIIPSALAYGTSSLSGTNGVPVPSNSVLVFTVDLIGFYGK